MSLASFAHGCKINYSLKVGQRLEHGRHEIESLFLPVALPSDRLELRRFPGQGGIRVRFLGPDGDKKRYSFINPKDNTLVKAHERYAALTGFSPKIDLAIVKSIPVGAGLGGGSANAAALLRCLQQEAKQAGAKTLDEAALHELAASIGADVPFFLVNRPAWATGIGDKLTFTDNPVAGLYLLVVCPDVFVSTAWAYAELDLVRQQKNACGEACPKLSENSARQGLTSEMHQANYSSPAGLLESGNDFEEVVFARYPSLARLKENLLEEGAAKAGLSGTGSSLFALFRESGKARANEKALASQGFMVYSQRM